MKDKYSSNGSNDYNSWAEQLSASASEYKEGGKFLLSKNDIELFDEKKAEKPATVVRVKRMGSTAKNERWRIFENDELKFILDGSKLSKKECAYLRTVEGANWLINIYKEGFKSLNELKIHLKKKLK